MVAMVVARIACSVRRAWPLLAYTAIPTHLLPNRRDLIFWVSVDTNGTRCVYIYPSEHKANSLRMEFLMALYTTDRFDAYIDCSYQPRKTQQLIDHNHVLPNQVSAFSQAESFTTNGAFPIHDDGHIMRAEPRQAIKRKHNKCSTRHCISLLLLQVNSSTTKTTIYTCISGLSLLELSWG